MKRVGFLATGSELVSGEILNTNSQSMSQFLLKHGVSLGEQLIVDDREANIRAAFEFMMNRHDAIITTGGLGPTSDDRTRFALAEFLNCPLSLNPESWERIEQRFEQRGRIPTENNRIQAMFPEGATIFPNSNGTADGCLVKKNHQLFFLLPGPPVECLPIFEKDIFPILQKAGYTTDVRLYRWKLEGVSESLIASKLDPFAEEHGLEIAYRAAKPILHIKVMLKSSDPIPEWIRQIESLLAPHSFEREFPT